eukprot:m.17422 g.17422  ORF g.17422 m.17422 type:complete len:460 (+) comp7448_c0_seq1:42-1421(+)
MSPSASAASTPKRTRRPAPSPSPSRRPVVFHFNPVYDPAPPQHRQSPVFDFNPVYDPVPPQHRKSPRRCMIYFCPLIICLVTVGALYIASVQRSKTDDRQQKSVGESTLVGVYNPATAHHCSVLANEMAVVSTCDKIWWPFRSNHGTHTLYKMKPNDRVELVHTSDVEPLALHVVNGHTDHIYKNIQDDQTLSLLLDFEAHVHHFAVSRENRHFIASTNRGVVGASLNWTETPTSDIVSLCTRNQTTTHSANHSATANLLCLRHLVLVHMSQNHAVAYYNGSFSIISVETWQVEFEFSVIESRLPFLNPPIRDGVTSIKLRWISPLAVQIALIDSVGLLIVNAVKYSLSRDFEITTSRPCGSRHAVALEWGATSKEGFPAHELIWITKWGKMYSATTFAVSLIEQPTAYCLNDFSNATITSAYWTQDLTTCHLVKNEQLHRVQVVAQGKVCARLALPNH